jgi:hypothetical protein
MANNMNSGLSATTNSFAKGLIKDLDDAYIPESVWTHARNAMNNSNLGKVGLIGNEPANKFCTKAPYTIIGAINLRNDEWIVYSTDDTNSEIGYFKEDQCAYTTIVNDPCLGFKKTNLIIGISKQNFDCSWQTYWADGLNPDRTMNVGNVDTAPFEQPWPGVPYICKDARPGDACIICEPKIPYQLDCDKIRLTKHIRIPCVHISKSAAGGSLPNGSYYAVVAYTVNGQKMTDYFNPSEVQAMFDHDNMAGSLQVTVDNLDNDIFTEFELVIVRTINQQTSAKRMGLYNTNGPINIEIDYINEALVSVPIELIPLRSPTYESSEAIYRNGQYALRVAPTSKFDFNYQPLANQIGTYWVMTEQRPDYYRRGGNQTGYMRDEQYAFWIRWVYNTGEKSSSYNIPGRPMLPGKELNPTTFTEYTSGYGEGSADNVEKAQFTDQGGPYVAPRIWEMINTAHVTSSSLPADTDIINSNLVIAKGRMGYWESTEKYPADKPEVWNSSSQTWSQVSTLPYNTSVVQDYDLCGKPVRHHKMPADILDVTISTDGNAGNFSRIRTEGALPKAIRILGVEFDNIRPPVDNDGNLIPGIVGYEILRSSREGNKSVVAKGIINNLRYYKNIKNKNIYYQNYPYNPLGVDYSLTSVPWSSTAGWNLDRNLLRTYSKDKFTFHSPDTQFTNPFLSPQELKLYGEVGSPNNVKGNFQEVPGHPKEKLPSNLAFAISMYVGIGIAIKAIQGKQTRAIELPRTFNAGINGEFLGTGAGVIVSKGAEVNLPYEEESNYQTQVTSIGNAALQATTNTNNGIIDLKESITVSNDLAGAAPTPVNWGKIGGGRTDTIERTDAGMMPETLKVLGGIVTFAQYMNQGADATLDIIRGVSKYRQYAAQYISHGDMHRHSNGNVKHQVGNSRRYIQDSAYLDNQLQQFSGTDYLTNTQGFTVNNLFRGRTVVLNLGKAAGNNTMASGSISNPSQTDTTLQTITTARNNGLINNATEHSFDEFNTSAYSYYAGLKIRLRNQYGQLDSVRQLTTGCTNFITIYRTSDRFATGPVYGGDVYIGRYTEKNTFFYFYDWLMDVPDGTELDYRLRTMITNPRFWADFTKFDTNTFLQGVLSAISSLQFGHIFNSLPSNLHNLDADPLAAGGWSSSSHLSQISSTFRLMVKNAWFYLFQSGVRDFFVESEYNVDLRDWGNQPVEWHYDAYRNTNLVNIFAIDTIKSGNYFKYDTSLSVSRVFNNFISWGNMQARYYNPHVAEVCYTKYKNRIVYSLPQTQDAVKDAWLVYLANNYKDFPTKVNSIKPINKTGSLILFEHDSPVQFLSSESMELDLGTKITIGDGSLFSQAMQNLSNSDPEFQHGSCQNRLSVINTPAGIFFMSQSQGKIFQISGEGLREISASGMRWWFNKYLPYTILQDFPDFKLTDNPIVGVGCQSTFDNTNLILYFCKRDYRLRPEYRGRVKMSEKGGRYFTLDDTFTIELGDPLYFEDTSWTVSYDPKLESWISFHDWHPELALSSKTYFLTTMTGPTGTGDIWRHNQRTDLFANYYGQDYPFELEYVGYTGQQVNTLKSIEYQLECYTYDVDGIDTYHVLNYNFDHAVISNTEQVSGVLNLNLAPNNNVIALVNYPIINPTSIDILYNKVEQKYRFNQFWDTTRDRGEYTYPNVQQPIWNTELNGYIRQLNINNLDYQKPAFQRKKFRHYTSHVLLYRNVSGPVKMLLKLSNDKNQNSPR